MKLEAINFLVSQFKSKGFISDDDINNAKDMEHEQTSRAIKENKPIRKRYGTIKKKTALGELIRWAEYNYLGFDDKAALVINKAKDLLEREKQDIIDAVDKHVVKRTDHGKRYAARLTGEEYFRRFFKNKL